MATGQENGAARCGTSRKPFDAHCRYFQPAQCLAAASARSTDVLSLVASSPYPARHKATRGTAVCEMRATPSGPLPMRSGTDSTGVQKQNGPLCSGPFVFGTASLSVGWRGRSRGRSRSRCCRGRRRSCRRCFRGCRSRCCRSRFGWLHRFSRCRRRRTCCRRFGRRWGFAAPSKNIVSDNGQDNDNHGNQPAAGTAARLHNRRAVDPRIRIERVVWIVWVRHESVLRG